MVGVNVSNEYVVYIFGGSPYRFQSGYQMLAVLTGIDEDIGIACFY